MPAYNEKKTWTIEYHHADGRSGTVAAETIIGRSGSFDYGNGMCGTITVEGNHGSCYDLRYCSGDLHMVMIESYFGKGLVKAIRA